MIQRLSQFAKVFSKQAAFLCVLIFTSHVLQAQNANRKGFYAAAGFLQVNFNESSELRISDTLVEDAGISFSDISTIGVQLGYFLNPHISVSTILSLPPNLEANGEGLLEGLSLGDATLVPIFAIGNYHFEFGNFEPFLGTGLVYVLVSDTEDDNLMALNAENALGFAFRGGVDYFFTPKFGVNVSALYTLVSTTITGAVSTTIPVFGGTPVSGEVSLDPLALQLGVVYRL